MIVKYQKEIDQLLDQVYIQIMEGLYGEISKEAFIADVLDKVGETYQTMSDKIDVGVLNGYSVETQMEMMFKYLNHLL